MRFDVAVAALLALACASSSPDLSKCPPVDEMQPLPSELCRSELDFIQFQRQLAAVVEDNTSPLLVRVEFDSQSVVEKICADPTSARGYARARKQLATRFVGVPLEKAPGPPCLANSRLDFNLRGVQYATLKSIARKCEREAIAARRVSEGRVDRPPSQFHNRREAAVYVSCMTQQQKSKDQIWLFDDIFTGRIAYLFYGTAESTPREKALHKCFPLYKETATSAMVDAPTLPTLPAENGREVATACMRSEGWSTVPAE
jgi:hypothetical protein